jgi:hypothetical protein
MRTIHGALAGLAGLAMMVATPVIAAPPQAPTATQTTLYKSLMELNGVTLNVRNVVTATRSSVEASLLTRSKKDAFTPAQLARLRALSDAEFAKAEGALVDAIATAQAGAFTTDELAQLIAANTTPEAATFMRAKFENGDANAAEVQRYMNEAAVSVIKSFNESVPVETSYDDGNTKIDRERLALARKLMAVEGSEALSRQFVSRQHILLVLDEAVRHLNVKKPTPEQKERLQAIADQVEDTLEDRIIDMNARAFAGKFGSSELNRLIQAMDNPAQKKLTAMRLADDGSLDAGASKRLQAASNAVVKAFEAEFPPPA